MNWSGGFLDSPGLEAWGAWVREVRVKKSWHYEGENHKAAIGEVRGGSTKYAVFDLATMEPVQYVGDPMGIGRGICDEWDVRLTQWGRDR